MFRGATWIRGLQTYTAANFGPGFGFGFDFDFDFPNEIKQSVSGSRMCVECRVYDRVPP